MHAEIMIVMTLHEPHSIFADIDCEYEEFSDTECSSGNEQL